MPQIEGSAHVAEDAMLADDVVVGHGAVVYGGTRVGAGCLIEPHAVLGKRARLRPGSSAARAGELEPLVIEDGVTVCSGAILYASAHVGAGAIIGDQSQLRERATLGAGSVLGRGSSIDFDVVVGARVLIQTGVYVTGGSVVEDDVFLGPGVLTTNDNAMGRHARRRGAERSRLSPGVSCRWRRRASSRGSRSARRRSSPRARSSPVTSGPARS